METSLSNLPEDIIHLIFSFVDDLTNEKAVQLGKLSKQFLAVLKKRPNLVFDSGEIYFAHAKYKVSNGEYEKRCRDEFNYILSTMEEENVQLNTLTLRAGEMLPDKDLYDRCIEVAIKKGLRKLNLNMCKNHVLPKFIFEAESLVELELGYGCCLKPGRRVVWPNLKRLILHNMDGVEEGEFGTIIQGCPSIEYLEVSSYSIIGRCIKIVNLGNLKQLEFWLVDDQRLEVNATPNLESIYCASNSMDTVRCMVDFGSTKYPNLKSVEVKSRIMEEHFFINFESRFPILENLVIENSRLSKRFNISSTSLKKIELKDTYILEEAFFDVPNLAQFKYKYTLNGFSKFLPYLSFTGNSKGWNSDIMLRDIGRNIDASWFLDLNDFLVGLNGSKTSITVDFEAVYSKKVRSKIASSTISIPCIRAFTVKTHHKKISWSSISAIVDGILLVCKPQVIVFSCRYLSDEFLKLIYEKLTSKSGHDDCGVTDVEMSYGKDTEDSIQSARFKDWNTFYEKFAKRKFVEPTNFSLEYCSGKCPKCRSIEPHLS